MKKKLRIEKLTRGITAKNIRHGLTFVAKNEVSENIRKTRVTD